jgi:hypothetical protein
MGRLGPLLGSIIYGMRTGMIHNGLLLCCHWHDEVDHKLTTEGCHAADANQYSSHRHFSAWEDQFKVKIGAIGWLGMVCNMDY